MLSVGFGKVYFQFFIGRSVLNQIEQFNVTV